MFSNPIASIIYSFLFLARMNTLPDMPTIWENLWGTDSDDDSWVDSDSDSDSDSEESAVVMEEGDLEVVVKNPVLFGPQRFIKLVLRAADQYHPTTPHIFQRLFRGDISSADARRSLQTCMPDNHPTLGRLTRELPGLFGQGTDSYVYTAPEGALLLRPDFDRSSLDVPWDIPGDNFSTEVRLGICPLYHCHHSHSPCLHRLHSAPSASDHSGIAFGP